MMQKNPISIFDQFGFREKSTNEHHRIGNCPFCGKADRFFINTTSANKSWDCKVCGREGGFKLFLSQIVDYCAAQLNTVYADKLIADRGNCITRGTLQSAKIGYHPVTQQFILPVYNLAGEIANIKMYNFHAMRNASGCAASMYGYWMNDYDKCDDIFICEGEWDGLAMYEIITDLRLTRVGFVAVPGAGTFKQDVLPLVKNKRVYFLYDNDDAGQKGMAKAITACAGIAASMQKIVWPEGTEDGYDIRDVLRHARTVEDAYNFICDNLVDANESPRVKGQPVAEFNGEIIPAQELYDVFKKHLHIPDTSLLDVIFGTVLANRLPGDPLWMFIVAPPGATKTEPLLSLTGSDVIEVLSTLTPHTLISGTNFGGGGDPSLVPKLNGKVLIVKDFTTILTLPITEREEIFGILRDVYDGECSKPFGNGIFRKYQSKFGIIAAVTPVIEMFTEEHAALGERFLRWRNYVPSSLSARRVYIQKALDNVGKEVEMRADMVQVAHRVLKADYSKSVPEVSEEYHGKIISLAQLVAILRGTVWREKYTKEITHKPFIELGTRVSKQLFKVMLGVGMFRQVEHAGEHEYKIAVNVARSSVPHRLVEAFKCIYKASPDGIASSEISKLTGLPSSTTQTIVENLCMLGAIRKEVDPLDRKNKYKLNDEIMEYIIDSEFFS